MSSPEAKPPSTSHRYAQLTWPEVAEWARLDPVCLVPVATLEDHGYHLPIDTDVVIAETLAEQAVLSRRANSLLLPTVTHGYTPHHMQFPGSITIDWKTFVDHLLDIGRSLVHHGFNRILFVNGHGSNVPLVEMAARLLMVEHPHSIAAAFWYLSGPESARLLAETRDSPAPGGIADHMEAVTVTDETRDRAAGGGRIVGVGNQRGGPAEKIAVLVGDLVVVIGEVVPEDGPATM